MEEKQVKLFIASAVLAADSIEQRKMYLWLSLLTPLASVALVGVIHAGFCASVWCYS